MALLPTGLWLHHLDLHFPSNDTSWMHAENTVSWSSSPSFIYGWTWARQGKAWAFAWLWFPTFGMISLWVDSGFAVHDRTLPEGLWIIILVSLRDTIECIHQQSPAWLHCHECCHEAKMSRYVADSVVLREGADGLGTHQDAVHMLGKLQEDIDALTPQTETCSQMSIILPIRYWLVLRERHFLLVSFYPFHLAKSSPTALTRASLHPATSCPRTGLSGTNGLSCKHDQVIGQPVFGLGWKLKKATSLSFELISTALFIEMHRFLRCYDGTLTVWAL